MNASYTELDEARNIADAARSIMSKGTSARDIAVLYRANFQSRAIEEAFIKKNIPYQLVGVRFFERKEIKDVLSYIRASLNRESWSDIGRIINVPARGIGKVSIAKIMAGKPELLPPAMRTKLSGFWKLLDDIRAEILEKKPSEAVKFVIQETGMERILREGDAEDEERLLNIRELVSVATQYDDFIGITTPKETSRLPQDTPYASAEASAGSPSPSLSPKRPSESLVSGGASEPATPPIFGNDSLPLEEQKIPAGIEALLANAALATDQDELEKNEDAVKLMTVHASKGLEFDHVFIAGMEQDLFPFKHIDDADMSESEREEERRLFYVALTRARKQVHLSYTMLRTVYGTQRINTPSEFIDDIEKNLIEDQAPPEKPSGAKALFIDF